MFAYIVQGATAESNERGPSEVRWGERRTRASVSIRSFPFSNELGARRCYWSIGFGEKVSDEEEVSMREGDEEEMTRLT